MTHDEAVEIVARNMYNVAVRVSGPYDWEGGVISPTVKGYYRKLAEPCVAELENAGMEY